MRKFYGEASVDMFLIGVKMYKSLRSVLQVVNNEILFRGNTTETESCTGFGSSHSTTGQRLRDARAQPSFDRTRSEMLLRSTVASLVSAYSMNRSSTSGRERSKLGCARAPHTPLPHLRA